MDDLLDLDMDNLSSSEEEQDEDVKMMDVDEDEAVDLELHAEELLNMMDEIDAAESPKKKEKKEKRKRPVDDKGKGEEGAEEEEEEDVDSLEYLFQDDDDVKASSEERTKKEAALRKLEERSKPPPPPPPKKKVAVAADKQRQKKAKVTEDTSLFPTKKDMVGLMAFIHSSGYTIICKGKEGDELSESQKNHVDEKAFAIANLFSRRLNSVSDRISAAIKATVHEARTSENSVQCDQLEILFDAIKKYKRLVVPGGADEKPDAICPFTLSKIDHDSAIRMVLIADDSEDTPIVFYTQDEVANIVRTLHTLYHFRAYFNLDLDRVIGSARKTLENSTEDPEIMWDAVFNPMESIPKQKRDQQPGTRLVGLKQDLLINVCKAIRAYVGDEPFKV